MKFAGSACLVTLFLFCAGVLNAQTCESELIEGNLTAQSEFFSGNPSYLTNYASDLKNQDIVIDAQSERDEFFCSTTFLRLSRVTYLLANIEENRESASRNTHYLRYLGEIVAEYDDIIGEYSLREAKDDFVGRSTEELKQLALQEASEIVSASSTFNVLALGDGHGDSPVHRVLFQQDGQLFIYEASFDNSFHETITEVPRVSRWRFGSYDTYFSNDSVGDQVRSWAAARNVEVRGAERELLYFGNSGHVIPLRWAVRSEEVRTRSLDAFFAAFMQFIEPSPFERLTVEETPLDTTNDPAAEEVEKKDGSIRSGDCLAYSNPEDQDLFAYLSPTGDSRSELVDLQEVSNSFRVVNGPFDPSPDSSTEMKIKTFQDTYFEGQEIASWVEVDLYGDSYFMVYEKKRSAGAAEFVRFELVECTN